MENLKNMLILKNLPSNIVEEALIILKPNSKINKEQYLKNGVREINNKDTGEAQEQDNYIIREAEFVITDFIEKLEKNQCEENNNIIKKKYNILKIITIALGLVGLVFIIF
ncbi:MAG: hypothetical protein FWF46_05900 [Oscillospiraceae bacterium]|nr:hypothetical protein [Oscillospiraceae bacterium]